MILKALRFIQASQRFLFAYLTIANICSAILPYINIYFSAKILDLLSSGYNRHVLLLNISMSVLCNGILNLFSKHYAQKQLAQSTLLCKNEQNALTLKLFRMDYAKLENADIQMRVNKYRENRFSPFEELIYVLGACISNIVGLGLAIAFLVPFFKVMFVTTGVGFAHSPWFGVAVVGGILACGSGGLVVNGAVSKKIYHLRDKYFTLNRLFSFYGDMLTDYNSGKEIRIFDSQDLILRHATTELRDKGVIIQKQIGLSRAWSSTFLVLMLAFLSYGIYAIIGLKGAAGLFGLGALVRYVGGFLQLVRCIFSVAKALGNLVHTKKHLKVFFGLIGMKEKVSGNEICTEPQSISVKNLGFCYPDAENKALDDVTIDLPIGEKIAIVGENGSGKSTFVKLLCGLYAPTDGEILLNGCPLSSYTNDSLCTQFSTVFQDFQLFSLPLGENVACKETVNKSTVHEKLEQVGFKKHHDLDVYLYHDLTTNGIEISGGEAQKLALARALYHDAPIVILDEPTAALDPFAEQEIYRKFDALIGGKTVLYISHRLSSCYFCDKIAVFDKGKLVQFGIHQALLADTQGKYFELWDTQAKYYI